MTYYLPAPHPAKSSSSVSAFFSSSKFDSVTPTSLTPVRKGNTVRKRARLASCSASRVAMRAGRLRLRVIWRTSPN